MLGKSSKGILWSCPFSYGAHNMSRSALLILTTWNFMHGFGTWVELPALLLHGCTWISDGLCTRQLASWRPFSIWTDWDRYLNLHIRSSGKRSFHRTSCSPHIRFVHILNPCLNSVLMFNVCPLKQRRVCSRDNENCEKQVIFWVPVSNRLLLAQLVKVHLTKTTKWSANCVALLRICTSINLLILNMYKMLELQLLQHAPFYWYFFTFFIDLYYIMFPEQVTLPGLVFCGREDIRAVKRPFETDIRVNVQEKPKVNVASW